MKHFCKGSTRRQGEPLRFRENGAGLSFQGRAPTLSVVRSSGPHRGGRIKLMSTNRYLQGKRIAPIPIHGQMSVPELIETSFQAYNSARLREGAQLFATRMLEDGVTVGMTLTGALTPAGLGISAIIPLMEAGSVSYTHLTLPTKA